MNHRQDLVHLITSNVSGVLSKVRNYANAQRQQTICASKPFSRTSNSPN